MRRVAVPGGQRVAGGLWGAGVLSVAGGQVGGGLGGGLGGGWEMGVGRWAEGDRCGKWTGGWTWVTDSESASLPVSSR